MGVHDVWSNGSKTFNVVFRTPVNGGQNRPTFLLMGNIAAQPFMMICTIRNLSDTLSPAACTDIIGDASTKMSVNINRHNGDASQLRINFTTQEGMGSRVQVLVPAGRITGQW